MRVHVDRSMCQAHNRCHSVAPDVYELDDMGFAHASMTTVPKELEEAACVDCSRRHRDGTVGLTPGPQWWPGSGTVAGGGFCARPEPPELNVTFSMSFFFPRVLGQQEYEDEGGRQGDEADP